MLDDPGEYRADIIYNPDNKWSVQGYVHIPIVKTSEFIPNNTFRLAVFGLADAINRMTNITAVVDNPQDTPPIVYWSSGNPIRPIKGNPVRGLSLDSLFVKHPPLVYILADKPFELTKAELQSFEFYMKRGGIIFIENARPGNKYLRLQLKSILKNMVIGPEYEYPEPYPAFEKIPPEHPVYHCFFDFDPAPPDGANQEYGAVTYSVTTYLEGLWIENRLVAIYSDRGYGLMWYDAPGNRDQRRMGVNLVVFALLQRKGYHRGEWYAYRDFPLEFTKEDAR